MDVKSTDLKLLDQKKKSLKSDLFEYNRFFPKRISDPANNHTFNNNVDTSFIDKANLDMGLISLFMVFISLRALIA